ncbi:hypothetical protein E2C01_042318 [Portunus trituberculatus]|uniref:Uncharacterized protein n=1 Tax=Portunus trituberculatus TaxID=210409 RepID=A0A5B7FPW5_PORTR|nr:hypothetical protein [Portunus trituberculatus]
MLLLLLGATSRPPAGGRKVSFLTLPHSLFSSSFSSCSCSCFCSSSYSKLFPFYITTPSTLPPCHTHTNTLLCPALPMNSAESRFSCTKSPGASTTPTSPPSTHTRASRSYLWW